jgi:C-8 sterol isomerase
MAPPTTATASRGTSTLTTLALLVAALAALFYYLDQHLEWFYVFEPEHLHDLSKRAIAAHGNDTRAIVGSIVQELDQKLGGKYLNFDEEWIFNNAGGAMGAMYIIHASEYLSFCFTFEEAWGSNAD